MDDDTTYTREDVYSAALRYYEGDQQAARDWVETYLPASPGLASTSGLPAAGQVLKRPVQLDADVVRFQNNKEKWIAFIGLVDGRPYEIFTGLADDEEGIFCPKSVSKGKIIKALDEQGNKRYDFQFVNKRGYKTTIEGLSDKFNPEFWNYAKLISGVLRYGMPIDQVVKLVGGLDLDNESINNWKEGVARALKRYLPDGGASANPNPA